MYMTPMGDTAAPAPADSSASPSLSDVVNSPSVSTGSAMALTYHGYKRTGSILWSLVYGALGYWKPAWMIPIAVAQGFGEKKPCP